jgi:hypothetical protein
MQKLQYAKEAQGQREALAFSKTAFAAALAEGRHTDASDAVVALISSVVRLLALGCK